MLANRDKFAVHNAVDVGALRDVGWSVISPQVSGDINGDGFYDARDYVTWRKTNGSQQQFNAWRANFGSPGAGAAAGSTTSSIPEPASFMLILSAAALVSCGVRRVS